jgi:hypothetical protein
VKRRKRIPMLKDLEFGGSADQVVVGPRLKVESFCDIVAAFHAMGGRHF